MGILEEMELQESNKLQSGEHDYLRIEQGHRDLLGYRY